MQDDEDRVGLELIPGMLTALEEGRTDDAISLATVLLEEQDARVAVLAVAQVALFMHANPTMPLGQLGLMMMPGVELTESRIDGEVIADILSIIEGTAADGSRTPEAEELLAQFDRRPGSSRLVSHLVMLNRLVVSNMKVQMIAPIMSKRSPEAAEAFAMAHARAVLLQQEPPNVFSQEWDDQ